MGMAGCKVYGPAWLWTRTGTRLTNFLKSPTRGSGGVTPPRDDESGGIATGRIGLAEVDPRGP